MLMIIYFKWNIKEMVFHSHCQPVFTEKFYCFILPFDICPLDNYDDLWKLLSIRWGKKENQINGQNLTIYSYLHGVCILKITAYNFLVFAKRMVTFESTLIISTWIKRKPKFVSFLTSQNHCRAKMDWW